MCNKITLALHEWRDGYWTWLAEATMDGISCICPVNISQREQPNLPYIAVKIKQYVAIQRRSGKIDNSIENGKTHRSLRNCFKVKNAPKAKERYIVK